MLITEMHYREGQALWTIDFCWLYEAWPFLALVLVLGLMTPGPDNPESPTTDSDLRGTL